MISKKACGGKEPHRFDLCLESLPGPGPGDRGLVGYFAGNNPGPSMAFHRTDLFRRPGDGCRRRARATRTSSMWPTPRRGFSNRRTEEPPSSPFSTTEGRCPSARSRCAPETRKSSMSAPERGSPGTARRSATESTSRSTAAGPGRTWGSTDSERFSRIVVDPRNPDIVFAAAMGHEWGPNKERGVFRSIDGGKSWTNVLYVNETTGASDLCLDPGKPQHHLRRDVRLSPPAVAFPERGTGQRALSFLGRRDQLDQAFRPGSRETGFPPGRSDGSGSPSAPGIRRSSMP